MTGEPIKDMVASVRARLLNLARRTRTHFPAQSRAAGKFKGLISGGYSELTKETDFP